ncbi:MAG TPA: AMP-binding protein, partial [Candidatus Solibacter sp.]|nr:AMP-binding protein [Candidatus Solibacter sp.]
MISPLTPLDFLARSAYTWRDSIAVVEGERRFTYAELAMRVERQSAALAALGVVAGDRVAVLSPNSAMALEAHFAPMRIGAIVVMLNTRLSAGELEWILKHCGAKVLLVDPALKPLAANAGVPHLIDDYEAFLQSTDGSCYAVPVTDENACIAINYTSGTTGFPKGVMYTHRGAWVNAIGEITQHGLDHHSVYLWTVPMFHCNGWCFTWAVTAAGGRHVCMRQPDAAEVVRLIEQEGATHLCGAPVVVSNFAQYCATNGIKFATGPRIVTGGAPPPPAVIRAAE